jgi:hypothetical protein
MAKDKSPRRERKATAKPSIEKTVTPAKKATKAPATKKR